MFLNINFFFTDNQQSSHFSKVHILLTARKPRGILTARPRGTGAAEPTKPRQV